MSSLTYSTGALNTLHLFHRKKFIVYVEGDDDVLFWGILLAKFGLTDLHVKVAGGVSELDKYIRSIVAENAEIIVARDCDYTDLLGTQVKHTRVLYTYGYSIENSIYCPSNISRAISTYAKSLGTFEFEVAEWIDEFVEALRRLIEMDLANELTGRGVQVLGSNCGRFLTGSASHRADESKITLALKDTGKHFKLREIANARRLIRQSSKPLPYILRGHFLTLAVVNYVKWRVRLESGKKIQLSLDALYALLISGFETSCRVGRDLAFVKRQVSKLRPKPRRISKKK